jgi:hypothetical protein
MSDYVSCPTCQGRGLVPLADAEAIEAHSAASWNEAQREQRERQTVIVRANFDARVAAAEARSAAIEAAVFASEAA